MCIRVYVSSIGDVEYLINWSLLVYIGLSHFSRKNFEYG